MPELEQPAERPAGRGDSPAAAASAVVVDERLVRTHQAAVWRWLRVLGAPAEVADDLTQDTFALLLGSPIDDRGTGPLRTWLRATARNLFLARCRRERRTPVVHDDDALERAWASYERDDDGAGYRAALHACLGTLPERQRALLEQQIHDRPGTAALAAAAGLEPEGARTLLRRIKQALRDCVRRRLRDDG